MGELRDELARVKLHVGLASLMRLFGDTRLAQFNPASKSFLQPLVLRHLLPGRVLQEALVNDLQNSPQRALTRHGVCAGGVLGGRPEIFFDFEPLKSMRIVCCAQKGRALAGPARQPLVFAFGMDALRFSVYSGVARRSH
jgi:hypothetical protein